MFSMEHPQQKWMMTGGTPILGNHIPTFAIEATAFAIFASEAGCDVSHTGAKWR